MTRRPGVTLVEVLVAIFIMGIGLLSVLALFPLGALRMAQAIQDDRAGHMGLNGAAIAQMFKVRNDPAVTPFITAPAGLAPTHPDLPGYPVYVDPIGLQTYLNPNGVGGVLGTAAGVPAIPRCAPAFARTPYSATGGMDPIKISRWFTLIDDLKFGNAGMPVAGGVQREGVFSYALLLRRPRSSVANVTELSVAVYYRRPLTPGVGFKNDEYPCVAVFNSPSTNMITLTPVTGNKLPPLRPGSWLLDATFKVGTINNAPALNSNNQPTGWAHGYFYRVVNVNQITAGKVEVEVATPLRDWPAVGSAANLLTGTVVVMDSVVEVLEKGTGW